MKTSQRNEIEKSPKEIANRDISPENRFVLRVQRLEPRKNSMKRNYFCFLKNDERWDDIQDEIEVFHRKCKILTRVYSSREINL